MSCCVHRLRIPILSLCLLALAGINVHAGNFENFKSLIQDQGFTYTTTLNGFSVYEKKNVSIMMRSCDGYCCEGLITAKPMSHEKLAVNVEWVYGSLQNTLEWKGRKFVDPKFMSDRVRKLVKQIFTNLEKNDRTEFAFDHLNVRGQCDPVPEKDYKAGKRPVLIIKLWIP